MKWVLDIIWRFKYPLILFTVIFLLSVQSINYSLQPGINPDFIKFYRDAFDLSMIGVLAGSIFLLYRDLKIGDILGIDRVMKVVIFVAFIVVISVSTIAGGQIIGLPTVSVEGFSFSNGEEIWLSSVYPAFGEDPIFLMYLPIFMLFLVVGSLEYIGVLKGTSEDRWKVMGIMMVISLLAATGIGPFLAGFTSAHSQAYGENQGSYAGAAVFGFGQSMVYMVTGITLPIAHAIHNAIVKSSEVYGFSLGSWQII